MNNFSTKKAFNGAVTGIATFAKCDLCTDIRNVQADIAVLGAPFDIAIQGKPGARLGPRGIRQGSTRFSYKSGGSYDPERDELYMDSELWRVVDCGDADYIPGDIESSNENLTEAVKILVEQGAFPVILGGDHSVTYPVLQGLEKLEKVNVLHIDAHLDWTASVCGQTKSNGSPMRNAAALPWIGKFVHLGIRGLGSSGPGDYADARAYGDTIYSVKETRRIGIEKIIEDLPRGSKVYVSIDIDGMDAAQAPATGSPIFGGFLYDDITEILETAAKHCDIIGCDMVEVSPPYDDNAGTTCYLAARIVSDLLGFVCKERERRGVKGVLSK